MQSGIIGVIVCSLFCYGCAQETNIESSMLESVTKWESWTDVTKSLDKYCDEWDSVLVVWGPTIDDELDEILGVYVQDMLQDGESGYYFFHQSSIRRVVTSGENKIQWSFGQRRFVSIQRGDTVLVRRIGSYGEAIVRRPTWQQ
jgi:hypothetical protein